MPEKTLKTIENCLLYSKKHFAIADDLHRRAHLTNDANAENRMDENLADRISKIAKQIQNEFAYRISLKFLSDLVNQCFKFNTKYVLTLETDMQKLFKTNINQADGAALPEAVDAAIIITNASYIQYEQFLLDKNLKTYLEETLQLEHMLRTRIKRMPYEKVYKLVVGTQS